MCNEFAPGLRVHKIKTRSHYLLPPADVYVSSYSKISGWEAVFSQKFFRSVVFDECQELRCGGFSDKYMAAVAASRAAEYVLGLSGTPIYNYGNETWNIADVLKQGCLGTKEEFEREWCYGKTVRDPVALGAYLRENYLMLRRTRKEVGKELPPVNKIIYPVEYNEEMVERAEEDLKVLAARVLSGSFTERGMAARELDMQARMMTGLAKAKGVANYVKILLESGEKVLLAGWHRDVYEIWLQEFEAFKPVMYTGSESPAQKEKSRLAFMSGESPLMIISLRSGVGLDGLQKASSLLVFGELDWSPGVHEQIIGRLRRDGQTQQVTALYLIANGGTDPLMVDILGLKASQAHGIINQEEDVLEMVSDDTRIKRLAQQILERRR
jgi:SNF2 family DNA or RNA helicase